MKTPLWMDDLRSRAPKPRVPRRSNAKSQPQPSSSGKPVPTPVAKKPATAGSPGVPGTPATVAVDTDLIVQRDRLIEKLTIMQCDIGGAFYEMAIRDHVKLDALTEKAAELQVVDAELSQVERAIELQVSGVVGRCPNCDEPHGAGVAFCSQCGHALVQVAPAASFVPPASVSTGPVATHAPVPGDSIATSLGRKAEEEAKAAKQAEADTSVSSAPAAATPASDQEKADKNEVAA